MSFDLGDYVDVKTRIQQFWDAYPDGRIECSEPQALTMDGRWFIASQVAIYRFHDDPTPAATGNAWEPFPGRSPYTKDSEAMNAETSAVGRALGNLGIGIGGSIATAEEVRNRRAEQAPISDEQRQELHKSLAALTPAQTAKVRGAWKAQKVRKLEELTAADLDRVNELIAEIVKADDDAEGEEAVA